jgi:carboxymethylenebutenolidase
LGGKLAYLLATHPEIACAVSYYGTGIQASLDQARNISCPTLLHIAMEDHLCPSEARASIVEAMKPHQDFVTVTTYPGVGHAFARHGSSAFDAASAARADAATLEILKKSTLS